MPPVASWHNNYWLWGRAGWTGEAAILIGVQPEAAAEWFTSIEDRGVLGCKWCLPGEPKAHILVVREPRISPDEFWSKVRRFM